MHFNKYNNSIALREHTALLG